MTTREDILNSLAAMLRVAGFDEVPVDEPEPSRWKPYEYNGPGQMSVYHAMAVQDGPPPTSLAFVRGGSDDEATEELEFEAAVAYAVQVKPGAGSTADDCRYERRRKRDEVVDLVRWLIKQDRTLGIGPEVYAEVGAVQRDDEITFANALPSATAVIPIRVLYTGSDAAA